MLTPDPLIRMIRRITEDKFFINQKPVTSLLDIVSKVTHISYDFCKVNGIKVQPISQIVDIEGTVGGIIDYLCYVEAKQNYPYPLVKYYLK